MHESSDLCCPQCGARDSFVTDTRGRKAGDRIYRRRECVACHVRFTTWEGCAEAIAATQLDIAALDARLDAIADAIEAVRNDLARWHGGVTTDPPDSV